MQMRTVCLDSVDNVRVLTVNDVDSRTVLLDQPFASTEMGDSMDADLVPELSGETWVAARYWRYLQQICHRRDQI